MIDERTSGCRYPNAACGQCTAANMLNAHGLSATPRDIDDYLAVRGYDLRDGTLPEWLVDAMKDRGLRTQVLNQTIAWSGRDIIVLHQCDSWARPVPVGATRIRHWRRILAYDGRVWTTYNPWGGIIEDVPDAVLRAADCQTQITPIVEDDGVYRDPKVMSDAEIDAVATMVIWQVWGRNFSSPAERDGHIADIRQLGWASHIRKLIDERGGKAPGWQA